MKSSALLLIGALLASSVWADEPAFDPSNSAIKKIVHDTAASQSVPVQLKETKLLDQELAFDIDFVKPAAAPDKPALQKPVAARHANGFLSALFETIIESALGLDDLNSSEQTHGEWRACEPGDPLKATPQISVMCPPVKK